MTEKERILKLLRDGIITIEESIDMLDRLNPQNNVEEKPVEKKVPEKTFDERISEIAEDAFNDFANHSENMQVVLKIMKEKDWVYFNEPVNYNSVKNTIIRNTKDALTYMIEQAIIGEGYCGTVSCGGFEVTAMGSDDQNDDDIEIEIKFIPYSGFGSCSLSELKKLHHEKYITVSHE
jgi:hypothetical protein